MLNRVLPLLSNFIPASIAAKGLEKVDSRFGKFIQGALASGYSIDTVLDFVKSKSGLESENFEQNRLAGSMRQGTAQPHEKASFEQMRQSEIPGKAIGSAAVIGGGALGGLSALNKSSEAQETPQEQKPIQQNQNPIAQYSDQLHSFIEDLISKGRSPLEAGALAQLEPKFKSVISKMEKDYKTPWSAILQSTYGDEGLTSKEQAVKKFREHQKKKGLVEGETERFQNQYGNQQNPNAKNDLLQAMQSLSQALKG